MKRALWTGVSIIALASSSALAADIPLRRMPVKAPIYLPYNWTGFYAGANIGWGWSTGSGTGVINGFPATGSASGNGFLGGLQLGYNYQVGSMVVGLETDIQATAGSGNFSGTAGPFAFSGTSRTPWFGTIRGRLGYAVDRWMVYATGGAVYGAGKIEGTITPGGAFGDTENFWTWTVGGGIETALSGRWTAKLEYLYVDKPNHSPIIPGTSAFSGSAHTHILRTGLNYRF